MSPVISITEEKLRGAIQIVLALEGNYSSELEERLFKGIKELKE